MDRFAARYLLLRKLGQGGMGEVFLARDLASGSVCAIKRLNPEIAEPLAVLRREFQALTQLRHPAIVQVFECAVAADGTPYLALEYVPGISSDQSIAKGDWSSVFTVGCRVLEGLEALHGAGVLHGDLKPSNILVSPVDSPHRDVRIVDFGLAALRSDPETARRGTFGFVAPEIMGGKLASPASDLFGLGASLYALLTGFSPLQQRDGEGSPVLIGSVPAPDVRALEAAGVPWKLIELLLWLLAENPDERPVSAREVRRELEHRAPQVAHSLERRLGVSRFVGRARELGVIEQWLALPKPNPVVTLIVGQSGVGRTAGMHEIAVRAKLNGRPVVFLSIDHGAAWGSGARALIQMLSAQLPADGAGMLRTLLERAQYLTDADLGEWVEKSASALSLCTDGMVIMVDDAHRLDRWSAVWLRRLILAELISPAWWILSHGTNAAELQILRDGGVAQSLELRCLPESDLATMVAVQLGNAPPPQLVSYLWRQAKGHPQLTLDLLHLLVRNGAVREDDHGISIIPEMLDDEVLGNVASARSERLKLLPHLQRDALAAAAIVGTLGQGDLIRILPELTTDDLLELERQGLLAVEGGQLSLASPSLRSLAIKMAPVETQARFHEAALSTPELPARKRFDHYRALKQIDCALAVAAQAFEEQPDTELAAAAGELAEEAESAEAGRWFYRAAELYRQDSQYTAAIPLYERALSNELNPSRRGELRFLISSSYLRSGDLRACLQQIELGLSEAVSPWSYRLRGIQAFARAVLSEPSAERDARTAFADAQQAKDWLGMGLACDGLIRLTLARGQASDALEWIRESAQAYRRAEYPLGVIRTMGSKVLAYRARGKVRMADRQAVLAVTLARQTNHRLALSEQLLKLGTARVELGQWQLARSAFAESLRLAIEDGRLIEVTIAMSHMALIDGLLGNPRLARRQARDAIRLAKRHQPDLVSYAWRTLAQAERLAGRFGLALMAARRAHASLSNLKSTEAQWCRIECGRVLAQQDRWQDALNVWNAGLHLATAESSALDVALLSVHSARAQFRLSQRDLVAPLLERARRILSKYPNAMLAAHFELLEAERLLTDGNSVEGHRVLGLALRRFADLPAPHERALAILQVAQVVPTAKARTPLSKLLQEAVGLFERCGDQKNRVAALSLAVKWNASTSGLDTPERELGLIERVSWLFSSLTDLDELLRRAMRAAVEQLGAERGVLLLADPVSGELSSAAEYGHIEVSTRQAARRYSKQVVKHVAAGGDSLLVVDAGSDSRIVSPSVQAMNIQSILCVPMFIGGRLVGVVYLDDSRRTHAFAEAHRGMVEGFAHLVAVAIDKSRSHEEVRQENERLGGENLSLRKAVGKGGHTRGVIGSSAPMRRVLTMVENAARTPTTVLLTGENGTGKQLIAEALHRSGKRANGPFVTVNCGAITETLLESELFGILPNVATGVRGRTGKFIQADGGTLFLDEIGDMPPSQQVALLAALQQRAVTPVGGNKEISFDARIVAATNRDLENLIEAGKFREDLFFRLSVINIPIPPLRERKADIPELTRVFLAQFAQQQERVVPKLSPDFFAVLLQSDWPGNVRALQNYLEGLLAMTPGNYLRPDPPPPDLSESGRSMPVRTRRLTKVMKDFERQVLVDALRTSGGNQSQAARELGLTEQALRYRLKKHRLQMSDTKAVRPPTRKQFLS